MLIQILNLQPVKFFLMLVGVWYAIEGDGEAKRVVIESSAEFDSRLAVFTGSCGQLSCVSSNSNTGFARTDSSLTFLTELGVTYHILVTSYTASVTNVGSFAFNVEVRRFPRVLPCSTFHSPRLSTS